MSLCVQQKLPHSGGHTHMHNMMHVLTPMNVKASSILIWLSLIYHAYKIMLYSLSHTHNSHLVLLTTPPSTTLSLVKLLWLFLTESELGPFHLLGFLFLCALSSPAAFLVNQLQSFGAVLAQAQPQNYILVIQCII